MNRESRKCQNCHQEFWIEPEDFNFYEKLKVPPPTFCPFCVYQRQIAFRNARNLYHRKDSKTGEDIISIYSPDKNFKVYEQKFWNGDGWDPLEYGRDYDFSRPFFEQMKDLMRVVPWASLNNWDAVNSDYCNFTKGNKNCYLVFGGDFNEDTRYSTFNFYTKNSGDLYWVNKGEHCYELIDSENNYRTTHGRYLVSCLDTNFGYELTGCQNCLGCVNLRNQKNYVFNERLTPEEYKKFMAENDLGNFKIQEKIRNKFEELKKKSIFRPYKILNSANCTGDNIYNSKNCKFCFDVFDGAEDCKYIFLAAGGLKDSYNSSHLGAQSELCYTSMSIYPASRCVGSWIILDSQDVGHSMNCRGCSHIFGCVGLRNKKYCILNKQYSKEEYETLVPKIIGRMKEMPYRNAVGHIYTYGDFFPSDLSPFGYNESVAYEQFPLSEKEAEAQGYFWYSPEEKIHNITVKAENLPDNIKEVSNSMLQETIGCAHEGKCNESCTKAFKLTAAELEFYRQLNMPLPRLCPNCRNAARVHERNPLQLWSGRCQCAGANSKNGVYKNTGSHFHGEGECPNEFETSYSPDRKEIIYCEQCYNAEVV